MEQIRVMNEARSMTFSSNSEQSSALEYYWKMSGNRRMLMSGFADAAIGLRRSLQQVLVSPEAPGSPPDPGGVRAPPPASNSNNGNGGGSNQASAFNTLDPNVVIILVVLLFALICAAFVNSIMRCVLRRVHRRRMALLGAGGLEGGAGGAGGGQGGDQMHGLDSKTLASLPVLTFKASEKSKESAADCTICLSEFVENEELRFLPKCNHVFHRDCVDMWLLSHISCPVCRAGIGDDQPNPSAPLDPDVHGQEGAGGSMIVGAPIGSTPNVQGELLRDRSGWGTSGAMIVSQQPQPSQEATSSRRSLRSALSGIFAPDNFLSLRWHDAPASSSAPVAPPAGSAIAMTPSSAR